LQEKKINSTTNLTNFAKFYGSIHQILNITIIKIKIIIKKRGKKKTPLMDGYLSTHECEVNIEKLANCFCNIEKIEKISKKN